MKQPNQLTIRMLRGVMLLLTTLLVPIGAWAEDYGLTVAGVEVTSDNASNVLGGETATVVFDATTNTLTLSGATFSGNIVRTNSDDLNVHLVGENTLTITNQNNYVFVGSGSLTITSDEATSGSLKTIHRCSKDSICSGWNDYPSFTYSRSDGEAAAFDCLWENYSYSDYMVIRENFKYNLWIGGQQFCTAMLEPDSGIKFVPSTNTLEYSYYGEYNFTSSLPALTISVRGTTRMGSVTFSPTDQQPAGTLTIQKDAESEADENGLTLSNDNSVISGFSSVVISEPLHLVTPSEAPATWDSNTTEAVISDATYYPLWVHGWQVSSANAGNILDGFNNDEATLAFDAETKTLTMNGVSYNPEDETPFVKSGLDSLTVKMKDFNNLYVSDQPDFTPSPAFVSINEEAVLTFTTEEHDRLALLNTQTIELASGFCSIAFTGYLYRDENSVKNLLAPSPGMDGDYLVVNRAGYEPDGTTFNYTIDYVDEELEAVTGIYDPGQTAEENGITLSGPCTVIVYAQYDTVKSAEKEGRCFGFAQNELNVAFGIEETDMPAIVPAVGDSVEVGYEGNVEEGKIILSNTTIAKNAALITAYFSNASDEMPFTILNDNASLMVNVVPPTPTIVFDSTKDYLNTDVVSIAMPDTLAEDQNARIMYSWVEDCEDGNGSNYTEDTKVTLTAGTGTLYAWVRYNSGTSADDAVFSGRVSQVFTVKSDISNAYIPEFTTTATYTGEAVTPLFQVMDSEKTQNEIDSENFTVSYQRSGDQLETVEQIVDAGTYVVTITGTGDTWGGSRTVTREFQVTQAENAMTTAPEAVADLVYTGEEQSLVAEGVAMFGTVQYKLGENGTYSIEIPVAAAAGTYTVYYKVDGSDNYTAMEEASVAVTIGQGTVTIAADNQTATYTGQPIAFDDTAIEVTPEELKETVVIDYFDTDPSVVATAMPEAMASAPTDCGTYYVVISIPESDNYASASVTKTLTIGKAEVTEVVLEETELTFNGEEQTVSVASVKAGNIELTADDYTISDNAATAVGTYTVTVTANENSNFSGSATATFTIGRRAVDADGLFVGNNTYATYYNADEDMNLPEGVVAYVLTGVNGNTVSTQAVSYVRQGTPVLLEKNGNLVERNDDITDNILTAAEEDTDVSSVDGTVYVLYNDTFVKSVRGTVPAGRCFLTIGMAAAGAPSFLLVDTISVTGIDTVKADGSAADEWYTLGGRKMLGKPAVKGLYIRNGKKTVIK